MGWETQIQQEGFGESADHEWRTVRSWSSFKKLFEDAIKLEGVTYCESPPLLLELLEDDAYELESIDLLIGHRDEFQSEINEVTIARRLEEQYRQGNLTIRLKNRKQVHSKLYRLTHPDDTVSLIAGSANLSYNSWTNQTNSLVIYEAKTGSTFDQEFQAWIHEHWEDYADTIFMEDLVQRLDEIDDEEEREQYLQLWVDERTSERTEQAEVHAEISDKLEGLGSDVRQAVRVEDNPDEATGSVEIEGGQEVEVTEEGGQAAIQKASTPDYDVRISTQNFDSDGYAANLEAKLARRGATASSDTLSIPVDTYTEYLHEQYDQWELWIDDEAGTVHLQIGEEHRILTADQEPRPDDLDTALANIENYIETVERWGETNQEEAVMAHMYEGILYAMWAPFVNLYAEQFHAQSTLDKTLPYLYIHGPSDAGKDQFSQFVLQLLSDGLVEGGADGDEVGKEKIRALREIDTAFPFVVSDISKNKIEKTDPLRNFWKDSWQPDSGTDFPTIIFTSNDTRPNEWFRNRAKMLHFDVVFPARPGDKNFIDAQADLNEITAADNALFSYVAYKMLNERPFEASKQTIGDVRDIFQEFYGIANRSVPRYFPGTAPAESKYDVGKRKWNNICRRDDVSFELQEPEDHLIADFDLDTYEVFQYRKVLPKQMRPEKSGRSIIIKNPDDFIEWVDVDPLAHESSSLFRRIVPFVQR